MEERCFALIGRADPGDASHESITEQAITEFCAEQQFPGPDKDALETIVAANGNTDFNEQFDSAAHFDCEEFSGGQIRLQRKLQEIRGASRPAILTKPGKRWGRHSTRSRISIRTVTGSKTIRY